MLSVAKLALGQEAYHTQQVALGLDDHYAGRGVATDAPQVESGG